MRDSRACAVVLGVLVGVLQGNAASAAEPAVDAQQSPDIGLLEYLGSLVEVRDGWVGPDDMQRSGAPTPPNVAEQDADE